MAAAAATGDPGDRLREQGASEVLKIDPRFASFAVVPKEGEEADANFPRASTRPPPAPPARATGAGRGRHPRPACGRRQSNPGRRRVAAALRGPCSRGPQSPSAPWLLRVPHTNP